MTLTLVRFAFILGLMLFVVGLDVFRFSNWQWVAAGSYPEVVMEAEIRAVLFGQCAAQSPLRQFNMKSTELAGSCYTKPPVFETPVPGHFFRR